MGTRRVLVASLFCAFGWVLGTGSSAYADPGATDPFGPPTDPSTSETANEVSPSQGEPTGSPADAYADTDPSALTDFRTALDPHGTWVQDPVYGTVWAPSADEVGADFTPYLTAGHWAYDSDYVWMSDYAWGWVTFHYGRWERSREIGWLWIPGRAYAGAWVSWRVGSEDFAYVGWAPMPATWAWHDGIAVGAEFPAWEPFVFCPHSDLFAPAVATRVVTGEPATAIAVHTRPYVPASPVVDGTVPASTGAAPKSAAMRRLARPAVLHGPPPARLGIEPSRVVHRTGNERGLANALAYARPSTAQALGAQPPAANVARSPPFVTPHYPTIGTRAPKRR